MSCLFCGSNLHLSQFCDVHKTPKSRMIIADGKKLCSKCFRKIRAHHCRICDSSQKCYICYSNDHHTFLCKSTAKQLFLPENDEILLSRFIQTFDPIEQIQFLFYSNPADVKLSWIRVINKPISEYNYVIFPPYIKSVIYKYRTLVADGRSLFDNIKHCRLFVFSKIIYLKNLQLSPQEFLLLLSKKTIELCCTSVNVFPKVIFSEVLVKIKNIEKLELHDTNIIIDSTWPKTLLKIVNGKTFRSLRMTINHIDFDCEALSEFMKKRIASNAHISIDIDAPLNYQEVNKIIKENLEKHFLRFQGINHALKWICIRFIERNEDMPKIVHSLGTYTL